VPARIAPFVKQSALVFAIALIATLPTVVGGLPGDVLYYLLVRKSSAKRANRS
jgi:hypothetical protein